MTPSEKKEKEKMMVEMTRDLFSIFIPATVIEKICEVLIRKGWRKP